MALILVFQVASQKSAVFVFTGVYKKFHKNFQRTSRWLLPHYDFFLQVSELSKKLDELSLKDWVNWTSFKINLIWAHLKFHYKFLFCSTSATVPESKLSSWTFSSYPIALWQCMMRKKTYMLLPVHQSFLLPLNYTNFFFPFFCSCEKTI